MKYKPNSLTFSTVLILYNFRRSILVTKIKNKSVNYYQHFRAEKKKKIFKLRFIRKDFTFALALLLIYLEICTKEKIELSLIPFIEMKIENEKYPFVRFPSFSFSCSNLNRMQGYGYKPASR